MRCTSGFADGTVATLPSPGQNIILQCHSCAFEPFAAE